ncbi:MAG: O-antigen ligase family protein, partial [Thermoguttaceae bacterium]
MFLRLVDACLAGVVFLVPLLMGGRHAVGQLALTVLAVTAALAWSADRLTACRRNGLSASGIPGLTFRDGFPPTLVLLLGVALLLVQTAPLPGWLLTRLAPHTAEILSLWHGGQGGSAWPAAWPCISLAPAETMASLVIFLDYGLLFLVALQRIRRIEDVERLLRWCAASAVVMATFGIVQFVTSNGRFFWFYEHPLAVTSDVAKGSFTNRNHFAQFLALGIGPLVWWLQDALRRKSAPHGRPSGGGRRVASSGSNLQGARTDDDLPAYWAGLMLGIVVFVGLLSLSRGGMAAMALAAVISALVCWRTKVFSGRLLAALGGAAVLIGVSLGIFGLDRVRDRLEDFSAGSLDRLDQSAGRRTIWAAAFSAATDFAPLGAGVGSFVSVYPMYHNALADEDRDATHAESGYLQLFVETGLPGVLLLAAGIALCAWWCVSGLRAGTPSRLRVCAGAIAASLAASAAHSAVDFVWYVPACMAIVALLAAAALRVRGFARDARVAVPATAKRATLVAVRASAQRMMMDAVPATAKRATIGTSLHWAAAILALSVLGVWMIGNRVGPAVAQPYFDRFMVEYLAVNARAAEAFDNDPVDQQTLAGWISLLESAVRCDSNHVAAHLRLVEIHQRLFEKLQQGGVNSMPLRHVSDAAAQQAFPTPDALRTWLSAAVGPHWEHLSLARCHAEQAVALSPLQGRAYLVLSELSFLSGDRGTLAQDCLKQALAVRPLDGAVLLAASQRASLAGDPQGALAYAKLSFQAGQHQRRQGLAALSAGTPDDSLPALIDSILV